MLAGPLLSEANLDKFCLKKKCPLLLDVKYDGERTLISYRKGEEMEMISRNGKSQDDFYHKLHQIVAQQLESTDTQTIKLDGEIVAIDKNTQAPLPFGELLKQKKFKANDLSPEEESNVLLLVYIFDVVEKDGVNLLEKPLIERRKLIPELPVFRTAEHRIIHFP
jgi:ATP-dependent DNA ligase